MKLLIDISEKDYRNFVLQNDNGVLEETVPSHRAKIAIANGHILPKGHGRLKDESDIVAQSVHYFNGTKTLGQCLDDCPTIIEADVCDNDCEHCEWVTCPKAEEGAEE